VKLELVSMLVMNDWQLAVMLLLNPISRGFGNWLVASGVAAAVMLEDATVVVAVVDTVNVELIELEAWSKLPARRPGPRPFALRYTLLPKKMRDSMLGISRAEGGWFVLGDDGAKACVRFFDEAWIYGATTGVWKTSTHRHRGASCPPWLRPT